MSVIGQPSMAVCSVTEQPHGPSLALKMPALPPVRRCGAP